VPALLPEDLALLVGSRQQWDPLRGARVLLTGGTGFVGRWLVSAFVHANREHRLDARLELLTRDPGTFTQACPELAVDDAVALIEGDVRTVDLRGVHCTHVIHGATPSDGRMNEERPEEMLEIIETGTRRMLDLARRRGGERFLLVSSGAVYLPPVPQGGYAEDSRIGPAWPEEPSAYHAGKRAAEALVLAASQAGLPVTIARLFAFVGPHLPLDRHFAIGNFIGDALGGGTVRVKGDGTPVRSYLYAAEMAAWLWAMLADELATGRSYNVGSEDAVSIIEAARVVAAAVEPGVAVSIARTGTTKAHDVYVPSTRRARQELGLRQTVGLVEAVRRTVAWHRAPRGGTCAG
jgi:dTDP-glucose 4,6-dehydratase